MLAAMLSRQKGAWGPGRPQHMTTLLNEQRYRLKCTKKNAMPFHLCFIFLMKCYVIFFLAVKPHGGH